VYKEIVLWVIKQQAGWENTKQCEHVLATYKGGKKGKHGNYSSSCSLLEHVPLLANSNTVKTELRSTQKLLKYWNGYSLLSQEEMEQNA